MMASLGKLMFSWQSDVLGQFYSLYWAQFLHREYILVLINSISSINYTMIFWLMHVKISEIKSHKPSLICAGLRLASAD